MDKKTFRDAVQEAFPDKAFTFKEHGCFMAVCENMAVYWHTDEGFTLAVFSQKASIRNTEKPLVMGDGDTITEALHDLHACVSLMQAAPSLFGSR